MAKLTDRQRKQIIAEYVDGGTSQRALAEKYKVSLGTISKILSDEESTQKVSLKKKENEQSMLQYLDSRKDKAQELIEEKGNGDPNALFRVGLFIFLFSSAYSYGISKLGEKHEKNCQDPYFCIGFRVRSLLVGRV